MSSAICCNPVISLVVIPHLCSNMMLYRSGGILTLVCLLWADMEALGFNILSTELVSVPGLMAMHVGMGIMQTDN